MLPPLAAGVVETPSILCCSIFTGEGLQFTATRPEPLVRMTMRADLDQCLADEAKKRGAPAGRVFGEPSPRPPRPGGIGHRARLFQARFLVAADAFRA